MKNLLFLLLGLSFYQAKATTWNVEVMNNQFSPSSLNVNVGDVIHWIWVAGFHTTSSQASIPPGASSWDASINSANNTFDYTVTKSGTYHYLCNIHGVSMSGTFTASVVVPVILSAFSISTQNKRPLLLWTTQMEMNVDHFSILKSINGADFKEISKVPATGNSSSERNYSFSDEEIITSIQFVYYSLAMIDKDGKTQLSPIKIFRNNKAKPKFIISLSPNPISGMGHLLIRFNAEKTGVMIAKVVDVQGKFILKTELSAEHGINNGHIHLGDIQAGVYTLYVSLEGIRETYRIVKN